MEGGTKSVLHSDAMTTRLLESSDVHGGGESWLAPDKRYSTRHALPAVKLDAR
jgi:hypothetical protein